MKYLIVCLVILIFTSCESEGVKLPDKGFTLITLNSGLKCVRYSSGQIGGVSCDWESYNKLGQGK